MMPCARDKFFCLQEILPENRKAMPSEEATGIAGCKDLFVWFVSIVRQASMVQASSPGEEWVIVTRGGNL
jgi:hypothetical protein